MHCVALRHHSQVIIYFYHLIDKINVEWLVGRLMERTSCATFIFNHFFYGGSSVAIHSLARSHRHIKINYWYLIDKNTTWTILSDAVNGNSNHVFFFFEILSYAKEHFHFSTVNSKQKKVAIWELFFALNMGYRKS